MTVLFQTYHSEKRECRRYESNYKVFLMEVINLRLLSILYYNLYLPLITVSCFYEPQRYWPRTADPKVLQKRRYFS